jgi:MinD-like ATPase involved in chromosome partitioning or flagellar assembly
MLIAVASVKGAPGVTRLAMTMAALWPHGASPTLIEGDPAGGTIAGRFGLEPSPSLTTLAAAMYPSAQEVRIGEHAQRLPGGLPVVVAPADPAGVRAAVADLAAFGGLLEQAADDPEAVLIVDCGRLDADRLSPVVALADEVLLVARPVPEMVGPLNASIKALRSTEAMVRLVLRGGGYDTGEMSRALGIDVAGRLPEASEAGLFARARRIAYARAVQQIALSVANRKRRQTAVASAPEGMA